MEERKTPTIAEHYELPSKGLIYDKEVNSKIEIRSMTGREDLRRCHNDGKFETIADIIENCLIEKPAVHVYDMALGDYEYLLHKMRVVTFGDSYLMNVRCPWCGEFKDYTVHLDELEVKDFDIQEFNELREIILPDCNKTVLLNYQTPHMIDVNEEKVKELKRKFKDADIDFTTFVAITSAINSVDGVKFDSYKAEDFVNRLSAKDQVKILNAMNKLNSYLGIETRMILECKDCGEEIPVTFRYGPEFFRPSNI